MEMEARSLVPLCEELQVQSLSGLRSAQQQLGTALAEFLRLPQKLKTVFDLTKTLSNDISGLVPASLLHQAETQAAAARHAQQQHLFAVEVLQRRLQALTIQGEQLP